MENVNFSVDLELVPSLPWKNTMSGRTSSILKLVLILQLFREDRMAGTLGVQLWLGLRGPVKKLTLYKKMPIFKLISNWSLHSQAMFQALY